MADLAKSFGRDWKALRAALGEEFRAAFGRDYNSREFVRAQDMSARGSTLGQIIDTFAEETERSLPEAPTEDVISDPALSEPDVTNLLRVSADGEAPIGQDPLASLRAQFATEFGLDEEQVGTILSDAGLGIEEEEDDELVSESAVLAMLFGGQEGVTRDVLPELIEQREKTPAEILALQQNLIAAGYLKPSKDLIGGWYGPETARAYLRLLRDAQVYEADPLHLVQQRMVLRGKLDPEVFEERIREKVDHAKRLDRVYRNVWGEQTPPGYLEDKLTMNPTEFEAFERGKESFPDSPMGQALEQDYEVRLLSWLQGGQRMPGMTPDSIEDLRRTHRAVTR